MKKISIIIPVGNDARIGDCLQSIENQSKLNELEVILIDNACSEEVKKIIDKYTYKISIQLIYSHSNNIGLLRNLAILRASSNILYFVDSDCILRKDAVSKAIESGEINEVTRGYIEFQGNSKIAKLDALLRHQRYMHDLNWAYCPNLVVRRDVFKTAGLFCEEFKYGSDGEFAKRLKEKGINCAYNKEMMLIHQSPQSNYEVMRRWILYGEGRKRRFKSSSLSDKIKGLFTPILFDMRKGLGYNSVVGLCLICRWYGWVKSK